MDIYIYICNIYIYNIVRHPSKKHPKSDPNIENYPYSGRTQSEYSLYEVLRADWNS